MCIKTYGTYLTLYTTWLRLNGITYELQEPAKTWHPVADKVLIFIPRQDTKEKRRWLVWWWYNIMPLIKARNNEMMRNQHIIGTQLLCFATSADNAFI